MHCIIRLIVYTVHWSMEFKKLLLYHYNIIIAIDQMLYMIILVFIININTLLLYNFIQ